MRHLRAAVLGTSLLLVLAGAMSGPLPAPFGPGVAIAASPAPSSDTGDTRSAGEAPGFVGSPFLAVAAVLALGAVALLGTIVFVRLTGGPGRGPEEPAPPGKP